MNPTRVAAALAVAAIRFAQPAAAETPKPMPPETNVTRVNYHGWTDAVRLSNGLVEAVVVPSVGRVMQFRFKGGEDGPFWENPALAGRSADPEAGDWANFGGDKAWPAPQAGWELATERAWPPPAGFDGRPMKAEIAGSVVTLISPVDPDYGIQTRRRIVLAADRPVMTITTTFEKLAGQPVEVGIWVITQMCDPVVVYAVQPDPPETGAAYVHLSDEPPPDLKLGSGRISLTRDPAENHKIGTRAGALVWVGRTELLRADSAVVAGAAYPDRGSSAEIYTNADPLPYVELEMLGPLVKMTAGDKIEQVVRYTLGRRTGEDVDADVRRMLPE
jgi:hypothetical protein